MEIYFSSAASLQLFAEQLARLLKGGEVFELIGDVGTGKTTFTKGLARGLGIQDDVQSPSFTISRTYSGRDGLELHHYDFYRLSDPGIMSHDIAESAHDHLAVTVVEWADTVTAVLPDDRSSLEFRYGEKDNDRSVTIKTDNPIVRSAYAAWNQNR